MTALALAAGQLDTGLQDRYWQDGFLHPITVMFHRGYVVGY